MAVLRSIESKLESLFEGVFGRAFRASVQPVEIARKLVKEMDDHRSVSVSRIYVPNEYTVYLSVADRQQFNGFEDKLCEELQEYLAEHARRERHVLVSPPRVKFETDDDLDLGVFGIQTRLVRGRNDAPPERAPATSQTAIYTPPARLVEPLDDEPAPIEPSAELIIAGVRHVLGSEPTVLGRSKKCDIQVLDPNVSRRHAEIRRENGGYTIVDLDSTNGIEVDGRRVHQLSLEHGSRFTVGSTEVTFFRETH
jgi:hypothetical protein